MNAACPRRVPLIMATGLPTIPTPTIGAPTGDRPAASGFAPALTGFTFCAQARPATPTESSSRRTVSLTALCFGLVVLVPLLSTPCCHDAVTVRYRTTPRRTGTDSRRSVSSPSQAHEQRAPPRGVRFARDGIWRDGAPRCGGRGGATAAREGAWAPSFQRAVRHFPNPTTRLHFDAATLSQSHANGKCFAAPGGLL